MPCDFKTSVRWVNLPLVAVLAILMALSVGSGETGLEGAWAAAYYIGLVFSILAIPLILASIFKFSMFNLAAHMGSLMLLVTLANVSCYIAIMYKSATPMLCTGLTLRVWLSLACSGTWVKWVGIILFGLSIACQLVYMVLTIREYGLFGQFQSVQYALTKGRAPRSQVSRRRKQASAPYDDDSASGSAGGSDGEVNVGLTRQGGRSGRRGRGAEDDSDVESDEGYPMRGTTGTEPKRGGRRGVGASPRQGGDAGATLSDEEANVGGGSLSRRNSVYDY